MLFLMSVRDSRSQIAYTGYKAQDSSKLSSLQAGSSYRDYFSCLVQRTNFLRVGMASRGEKGEKGGKANCGRCSWNRHTYLESKPGVRAPKLLFRCEARNKANTASRSVVFISLAMRSKCFLKRGSTEACRKNSSKRPNFSRDSRQ